MDTRTTVTAVIPTVGRATLSAAVDSVTRQSHEVEEIVIVNDSSDQAPQSPRLPVSVTELFTGGQAGEGAARPLGIESVSTRFVAFLDHDDLWLPHHLRAAVKAFRANPELDLYAARALVAHPGDVRSSTCVDYRGHQRLVDFYYGPRTFASRRRALPPTTWVFCRGMSTLSFTADRTLSPDIWWLIGQDERGCKIRQPSTFDAIWHEDPQRTVGRYSAEALADWALHLEEVRPGAGGYFLIGQVGRLYARRGMKSEWEQLMADLPSGLVLTRGHRLVRHLERLLLTCSVTPSGVG